MAQELIINTQNPDAIIDWFLRGVAEGSGPFCLYTF